LRLLSCLLPQENMLCLPFAAVLLGLAAYGQQANFVCMTPCRVPLWSCINGGIPGHEIPRLQKCVSGMISRGEVDDAECIQCYESQVIGQTIFPTQSPTSVQSGTRAPTSTTVCSVHRRRRLCEANPACIWMDDKDHHRHEKSKNDNGEDDHDDDDHSDAHDDHDDAHEDDHDDDAHDDDDHDDAHDDDDHDDALVDDHDDDDHNDAHNDDDHEDDHDDDDHEDDHVDKNDDHLHACVLISAENTPSPTVGTGYIDEIKPCLTYCKDQAMTCAFDYGINTSNINAMRECVHEIATDEASDLKSDECSSCIEDVFQVLGDPNNPPEGGFLFFPDYVKFVQNKGTMSRCKSAGGKWKQGKTKTRCVPPKREKKLRCREVTDMSVCLAAGCTDNKKKGRCAGANKWEFR